MPPTILFISKALSLFIIAGQVLLVAGLAYFCTRQQKNDKLVAFIARHALTLAFVLAAGATFGTLFYSEVVGLAACSLCWYQRAALYPQVLILGMALYKSKQKGGTVPPFADCAIVLSLAGALFAAYHSYLQYTGTQSPTCSLLATAVDCSTRQVFEFGYVTIPVMSLTAFSLLLFLMVVYKRFSARVQ